ncbi:MAG: T9SS type A sorting domain-containing protein [Candidatus Latescibacteria bacterium]|nr:T9SS type A sorting domain-containing protein [Candidatus Latescibacterota bacterium]
MVCFFSRVALAAWMLLLPLAVAAEERICGTRWLEQHRASFPAAASKAVGASQEVGPIEVGTQLPFYVPTEFVLKLATCRYKGTHCYIFVEESQWDIIASQPDVDKLGALFDAATPADPERGIFKLAVDAFGEPADKDGDPRIFILILDLPGNIVGYFDRAVYESWLPELRRDTVYLDASKLAFSAYLAHATLAHEFQHLIHWGRDADEEAWIDEGLAGYAEDLVGFPEADPSMVPSFLADPSINLTHWVSESANYGKTYLFASFLAERYGAGLIRQIVAEPRNGILGIDDAFKNQSWIENYAGAWRLWIAANYAAGYEALRGRRAAAIAAPDVPFAELAGEVGNQWGAANVVIRSEGDVVVDFAGSDEGEYTVWVYALRDQRGELIAMELGADNTGQVQVAAVDSAAVIVGRTSPTGGEFTLAARYFTPTVVAMQADEQAEASDLAPAYPNPANSAVNLPFRLAGEADVELAIYNALGQRAALLVAERLGAGQHLARWSSDRAASGAYWAVLKVGGEMRTRRLMLVR